MRIACALFLSCSVAFAAGCVSGGHRSVLPALYPTPDLVPISTGVQVIPDYEEPIFYGDDFYWWFFDGRWYRSGAYTGGWVRTAAPPSAIVRIESPQRYRRYRPHYYVVHHRPVPSARVVRPTARNPVSYRELQAHRR